jgi:hypothetical protein
MAHFTKETPRGVPSGAEIGSGQSLLGKGSIAQADPTKRASEPADLFSDKGREYGVQSVERGLGNAAGGAFDFVNMPINAGLQAGCTIFTGHPRTPAVCFGQSGHPRQGCQ